MAPKVGVLQLKEYGEVVEIRQDVVHIIGLANCMNGQMVRLGETCAGLIVGFDREYVLALLVDEGAAVKPGDRVTTTLAQFRVPVGPAFLGRRVNALGRPTDGKGPIQESDFFPIFAPAPPVLDRIPLTEILETGTKIVDMMKPIGKGQRMLIIGDRMTGKTTIGVDAILNQRGKNVICVYCAIGKAESAINKVIESLDAGHAWDYTILVAATASDPMGQQYLAPYVAASLGEYFMHREGRDVLVVFDDFTKHAWAYRQISLLLQRPPGRDAYPGDIFYIHSQLVERAGKMRPEKGGGSMTHLPIVETLQGDVAGYIPSNSISMTDGQIYMSSALFSEGFKPAIDMGLSVSRIGSRVQWTAVKQLTKMLQLEFVRYKELERLTRIKAGVSADVQARLNYGKVLEELLKQEANEPVPMVDQVILLFAFQQGFFKDVPPPDVRTRLRQLIEQIRRRRPDLVHQIEAQKRLTDEIKEGLMRELAEFHPPA